MKVFNVATLTNNNAQPHVIIQLTNGDTIAYRDPLFIDCFFSDEPDFDHWSGGQLTDLKPADFGETVKVILF